MKTGTVVFTLIARAVCLLGMVIPLYAAIKEPISSELAGLFLSFLVAYFMTYVADYVAFLHGKRPSQAVVGPPPPHPMPSQHDVDLFRIMKNTMDPQLTMRFFDEHDFANPF